MCEIDGLLIVPRMGFQPCRWTSIDILSISWVISCICVAVSTSVDAMFFMIVSHCRIFASSAERATCSIGEGARAASDLPNSSHGGRWCRGTQRVHGDGERRRWGETKPNVERMEVIRGNVLSVPHAQMQSSKTPALESTLRANEGMNKRRWIGAPTDGNLSRFRKNGANSGRICNSSSE